MSQTRLVYAGFWRRFNAYGIDSLLVVILTFIVSMTVGDVFAQSPEDIQALVDSGLLQPGTNPQDVMAQLLGSNGVGSLISFDDFILPILISAAYNIFFVTGNWRATPGKRWCKIEVVTLYGDRITLLQSTLRHVASGASIWLLGLGYLPILFTRQKTAWHDIICETRVIRRDLSVIGEEITLNSQDNA